MLKGGHKMYCTKCGTENDEDSKFCTNCGNGTSLGKSSDSKTGKRGINFKNIKIPFKNIKIPKTIFVIFGLLIILAAVITLIPNANKNNDTNDNNVDSTEDTIPDKDIQKDIQNLKTDDTIKVSIDSIPTGANIYIDNEFRGNAPKVVGLVKGNYSLKINMTGYKGIRTDINITSDIARQEIMATLEPTG